MGQLFERLGQPDSAVAAYHRVVGVTTLDGLRFAQNYSYAPSLKRLGELYESRGDRAKAAEYYGRFVELWKKADPALQPTLKEVRTRLAQLSQEPGG
jgi:tetratricopeptide (TPR) repeat protein